MSTAHFTKDHEWVRIENGDAVCGISDHAQKALGDIVYVELPAIGKKVKQGEQVAVVESSKAASEVYAPVSGEVIAVNDILSADPGKVNAAPMREGWMFKLKPTNAAEAAALMDESAYNSYVKGLVA